MKYVAIIGSRQPTTYGISVTKALCKQLVDSNIVIVSGLALGIDSIAHQATIDSGGHTIIVLPSPLEQVYPVRHRKLAKDILGSGGMLVSEYTENNQRSSYPQKYQFIARNRIIAGLADAIVIVEATDKSGSLHTANFGLELGIEVLAVPGNIDSPQSAGTNKLIQNGATPVLTVGDILNCLE